MKSSAKQMKVAGVARDVGFVVAAERKLVRPERCRRHIDIAVRAPHQRESRQAAFRRVSRSG